jgi:hypothetical protein
MIRKSGNRFFLATNAERVCAETMLKERDENMMRFNLIASCSSMSRNTKILLRLLPLLLLCSLRPAAAAGICPLRDGQAVRSVSLFDGPPEEQADELLRAS